MQPKTLVIVSIMILAVPIFLIVFLNLNPTLSPQKQNLEECKTLSYNGENKINLVLFSSKEQAEKYSDYLLTISPFDKNKDAFNFYYIDSHSPQCELYKGIAILCYSKELIKKASSCPNDYIIILKDMDSNIRSSSYMNVMSLNLNHLLSVFPHEFGHAFAILAEEYTPAEIPKTSKNCQPSCDNFEIKDGCFQGCSNEDYYRSIENGIMRTLYSNNYGIFNEKLILDKITKNANSKITGFALENLGVDCTKESYLLIEGTYNKEETKILDKSIEQGCIGTNGNGFFEYKIIMKDNSILAEGNFNPELIFTDAQEQDQEQINGETFISDKPFLLKIPVIENSKSLEISKDNQIVSEINLQNIGKEFCKIK
ncbi:MAG: hypothetical protein WC584_03550 [Candidatus Pacearchaeota archaeon]